MKRRCVLPMLMMAIALTLTSCTNQRPAIEQMPYPEAEDNAYSMSMDYWSTRSLESMWDFAEVIVVGKYQNAAPESVNINRNPSNPQEEADSVYYEQLVYAFEVEAVLKGELSKNNIRLGLFHGLKVEDKTYPTETFQQPDTQSYKVMFLLYTEYGDFYYPCAQDWWLSTEHKEHSVAP